MILCCKCRVGRGRVPRTGRGGDPGHFASGRGDARGGFTDRKSPSPHLPEIIIISPHSKKFGETFYYRTFYLTFIVCQNSAQFLKKQIKLFSNKLKAIQVKWFIDLSIIFDKTLV